MHQDPQIAAEAKNHLGQLFTGLGRQAQSGGQADPGLLGGINIAEEFAEFLSMPLDLARLFAEMGIDLAELVIKSLGEAGYILVRGMTPA